MDWGFFQRLFAWIANIFKHKAKNIQATDISGIKVESGGKITATNSSIQGEVKISKE